MSSADLSPFTLFQAAHVSTARLQFASERSWVFCNFRAAVGSVTLQFLAEYIPFSFSSCPVWVEALWGGEQGKQS